jgi:hypothetical protein
MKEARLENWLVIGKGETYTPPEMKTMCLAGKVFGHPDFEDGEKVITSRVMHAEGKKVLTYNTAYILGKVSKEYHDWYVKEYEKPFNEDSPFSSNED